MSTKILLVLLILSLPATVGAQNASQQDDSGILSSSLGVEITDGYGNKTGQSSSSPSTISWIIILGLIFLGVVIYSFDIDPKWVLLLIGLAGLIYFLSRLGIVPL